MAAESEEDERGAEAEEYEISLFELATILLRNRWRIVRWMVIGAVLSVLPVLSNPPIYVASASFIPQGSDAGRSGLASLAGQFGVSLPSENRSQSPEFYTKLLKSREILTPIVVDTFSVQELGGRRISFFELFGVTADSGRRREEQGVEVLSGAISPSIDKVTGIVELSARTQWPSVSLSIVRELLDAVNSFNQRTRQSQAAAEGKFVEERLAVAATDLRLAEDRMERFLKTNRQFANSPDLTFERDRIQRDLVLQQQVFTSLTQAYEEVRVREVRDTPVITVIESPAVASRPLPRGRTKRGVLGILLGGFAAAIAVFISETLRRRREDGDPRVAEFLGSAKEILGPGRWLAGRRWGRRPTLP